MKNLLLFNCLMFYRKRSNLELDVIISRKHLCARDVVLRPIKAPKKHGIAYINEKKIIKTKSNPWEVKTRVTFLTGIQFL